MTPLLWALVVVVALWLLGTAALVLVLWWVSRRDPVDTHWLTVADLLSEPPRTPGEQLADEVEEWLCANYCPHSTEEH